MTFTRVSPTYKHGIDTTGEGLQNEDWIDSSRAHDPDNPHVRGVLKPGNASQIGPGIGTPVAQEGNYFRLKLIWHMDAPVFFPSVN